MDNAKQLAHKLFSATGKPNYYLFYKALDSENDGAEEERTPC